MRDMVRVPPTSKSSRYQAPSMRLGRSQFDLSHGHKTTFDAGDLVPYFLAEVIPGDTFTVDLFAFARILSPLQAPVMDNIEMGIDFFFVPNRLVWTNWTAFLGEHDAAGAQDTDYTVPVLATGYGVPAANDELHSYFGVPAGLSTTTEDVCALPARCYGLVYNEWYRDQSLIDEVAVATGDGPDTVGTHIPRYLLKSAKKHDYFTSGLPYLQKGTAQVASLTGTIAVATDALDNEAVGVYQSGDAGWRRLDIGASSDLEVDGVAASEYLYANFELPGSPGGTVGGISINALREAAAVQRMLERDARGGTRHPELIRAHFGVDVPDYRTQRPEYLGGGKGYINISPIARTGTEAASSENVGELTGIGTGTLTAKFAKSFVEHGWVLGILRARAEVSYSQGLDRMWSRSTKYDFLWPELAMLGEQPIYNKELWIEGDATDDDVFAYQERYAEYRFKKSLITGKLAPDATGALDHWHLSEDFASQPSLNQTFIEDASPMSRIQAVTTEPDFVIDGRFNFRVARALPVRPSPTLMPARF